MPSAWIPANNGGFAAMQNLMLQLAGNPAAAQQFSLVTTSMQNRFFAAARLSAIASCACAALTSYAQNAPAAEAGNLATTVVTAARVEQNLHDVIADMTIVDRATIEKSGANTVTDILARQPGIEISRTGSPASTTKLFLRGGLSQYTAVLIDGVRVDSQNFSAISR